MEELLKELREENEQLKKENEILKNLENDFIEKNIVLLNEISALRKENANLMLARR